MSSRPLTPEAEEATRRALAASWSDRTQPAFNPAVPSYCQCAQSAIVVFEHFGGEILKTQVLTTDGRAIEHFYNRIGARRYDFTLDQFSIPNYWQPLEYQDIPSSLSEAAATLQSSQLNAMREAFRREMNSANAG